LAGYGVQNGPVACWGAAATCSGNLTTLVPPTAEANKLLAEANKTPFEKPSTYLENETNQMQRHIEKAWPCK
jgi:hypothetical protein